MNNKTTKQYFLERICELKSKKEALSEGRWDYEYKKRLKEVEFMLNDYPQWLNDETIKENDILNHRDLLINRYVNEAMQEYADELESIEVNKLKSELSSLKAELDKEREKHRWIPVTELLPNKDEYVLVYSTQMGIHEDKFTGLRINGQPEFYGNREEYDMGVTHWQTLPSPPNHNTKSLNNE
jgi:hypothetical protein